MYILTKEYCTRYGRAQETFRILRRATGGYTEGRQVLVFGVVLCMSEARSRLKR
jgi:hypothetical protein